MSGNLVCAPNPCQLADRPTGTHRSAGKFGARRRFDRLSGRVYGGGFLGATTAMTTTETNLGQLEKSLAELETLVERLEGGELSLEQALAEFERGMKLTRECQAVLKEAEQKVEILLKKTDQAEPEPFPSGGNGDA